MDGRQIRDILIVDKSTEGNRRIITAADARLDESADQAGVVSLALDKVFTQLSYPRMVTATTTRSPTPWCTPFS